MSKKKKRKYQNVFKLPNMLFADKNGKIYDHPELFMTGMSFDENVCPSPDELITIPDYSKLFFLPETKPVGYDPVEKDFVIVDSVFIDGKEIECFAVSAFLTPGYARIYLPGADYEKKKITLPLWSYTAVGIDEHGNYKVAAFPVELNRKWNPDNYDDTLLLPEIKKFEKKFPNNRLMTHLKRCATEYHCFAAKNLFLGRWEAPLPVAQGCNSRCLGCLSLQKGKNACASHMRIVFKPSVQELVELAVPHLQHAEDAMVSFGQGCEGEPLTESELLKECIIEIRKQTNRGNINLNTNGSMPDKIEELVKAGLNSVRISLNSATPDLYNAYYKPVNYTFDDVKKFTKLAKSSGIFTMINYLIFPGVSDTEQEFENLKEFIKETNIDFIHFKNLCIDPVDYIQKVGKGEGNTLGIRGMFELLREEFPDVEIGYFNKNTVKFIGYD